MKIKTLISKLNKKNIDQLKEYCVHNMKLTKKDLIYYLEEDDDIKVNRKITYLQIVKQYREDVIRLIVELWENCD